jgi:hypothetical protein
MFANELGSEKQVPNFPKRVISANTDDDDAVQEALANWVTFTSESECLESLNTATIYLNDDFELYDVVLLDALADGNGYNDREDPVAFKSTIAKR